MKGKNAIEQHGLITLIFSLLRSWHQIKAEKGTYKQAILNKHIVTVKKYVTGREEQRKVLIGMQLFFCSLNTEGPLGGMQASFFPSATSS